MDYGSLMCWATNAVGRQEKPCVYHLIPAGRPEPVSNCTVLNQTYSTLHVACKAGFDGGLPQSFSMQVCYLFVFHSFYFNILHVNRCSLNR